MKFVSKAWERERKTALATNLDPSILLYYNIVIDNLSIELISLVGVGAKTSFNVSLTEREKHNFVE